MSRLKLVLALILGLTAAWLAWSCGVGLFRLAEAGYGDSYILFDVLHLKKTGVIYRDLTLPPYLPAQYSPAVYWMYRLAAWPVDGNPFFGPRLIALAAFLACVAMAGSLARRLTAQRHGFWWGALIAGSFPCMQTWPLQLRGDFAGAFFGLACMRFLISETRLAVLLAGLCAGFATQFKFTFVAPALAGSIWLLGQKRWSGAVTFLLGAALTSAGFYALYWLREPAMLSQMLALSPGIWEPAGAFKFLVQACTQPGALLALLAIPVLLRERSAPRVLIALYAAVSLAFAVVLDMQAGGNVNYFFEALLAMTPLAVLGICGFRHPRFAVAATALVAVSALTRLSALPTPAQVSVQNARFRKVEAFLGRHHFLSTIPRFAIIDPEPALTEPYLLAYQEKLGKLASTPLPERVGAGEFEFVVTPYLPAQWRGVMHGGEGLRRSIDDAYRPLCAMDDALWRIPAIRPPDAALVGQLTVLGCEQDSTTSVIFR